MNALLTPEDVKNLKLQNGSLVRSTKSEKYKRAPAADRTWNGVLYDSKRELEIAQSLDLCLRQGIYKRVDRQVKFPIVWPGSGVHICTLVIDFVLTYPDHSREALEVKGCPTAVWKLKEKMFRAAFPKWKLRVIR